MANIKFSALTEKVTPEANDIIAITDVNGNIVSKKATLSNLGKGITIPNASQITDFTNAVNTNTNVSANTAKVGVTTQISNVVEDLNPQLGGNLDLNNKAIVRLETAGEALVAGNLCYLKTDGKYWKADATAQATCDTDLLMANATIALNATGEFVEYGEFTTTGLVAGSKYYVSETTGAITSVAPITSLSIVRLIGYAKSTTVLAFKPDTTFVENL